jgi:hypothetical protein
VGKSGARCGGAKLVRDGSTSVRVCVERRWERTTEVKLEGEEMTTGFQCVAVLLFSLEEGPLVVTHDISHRRVTETDPV